MSYPGEAIKQTFFEWPSTREVGDVRIMDYGKDSKTRYRVACFCPGRLIDDIPGDTPKTVPECDQWCATLTEANNWFALYVDREKRDGWVVRIENNEVRRRTA